MSSILLLSFLVLHTRFVVRNYRCLEFVWNMVGSSKRGVVACQRVYGGSAGITMNVRASLSSFTLRLGHTQRLGLGLLCVAQNAF